MWKSIMNAYNTNPVFQAFVSGLEGAIVSTIATWTGGVPSTKAEWIVFFSFIGKGVYGFIKRYMQQNIASKSVVATA